MNWKNAATASQVLMIYFWVVFACLNLTVKFYCNLEAYSNDFVFSLKVSYFFMTQIVIVQIILVIIT